MKWARLSNCGFGKIRKIVACSSSFSFGEKTKSHTLFNYSNSVWSMTALNAVFVINLRLKIWAALKGVCTKYCIHRSFVYCEVAELVGSAAIIIHCCVTQRLWPWQYTVHSRQNLWIVWTSHFLRGVNHSTGLFFLLSPVSLCQKKNVTTVTLRKIIEAWCGLITNATPVMCCQGVIKLN